VHETAGRTQADAQRRGHLGTHGRPGIHRPVLVFAAFGAAQLEQLPGRIQPTRRRLGLGTPRGTHLIDQRPRPGGVGGREVLMQPGVEHVFEYSRER
jgi:hypothetical protein